MYLQLVEGNVASRYPWLIPQFHTDTLQALISRSYPSLEWALSSPPKPHAFVSLPLQSFMPTSSLLLDSDVNDAGGESSKSDSQNNPSSSEISSELKSATAFNTSLDPNVNNLNKDSSTSQYNAKEAQEAREKKLTKLMNKVIGDLTIKKFKGENVDSALIKGLKGKKIPEAEDNINTENKSLKRDHDSIDKSIQEPAKKRSDVS